MKYEITNIQHPANPNLFRIRALRDISLFNVKAGELGGYVEQGENLSQEGECWVGGDARICDYATVEDIACVYGNALIFGEAWVHDSAHVFGDARVWDKARIYRQAVLNERMSVSGVCHITSASQIYYIDGIITAYFDVRGKLIVNGNPSDIEHHKTLARLKLL